MPPRLPRYNPQHHAEAKRQVDRAVGDDEVEVFRSRAGGDPRKLRGVPIQARGIGGTSPGTNPAALDTLTRRTP